MHATAAPHRDDNQQWLRNTVPAEHFLITNNVHRSPEAGLLKSPSKEGNSLIRALSGLPKLGRGDKTRSGGLLALLGKGKENGVASEPSSDPPVGPYCTCLQAARLDYCPSISGHTVTVITVVNDNVNVYRLCMCRALQQLLPAIFLPTDQQLGLSH